MKLFASLISALVLAGPLAARADSYTIDGRHTFPVFEVDHYGFSTQRGRFGKVTGKLELDLERQEGSVDITIDANSIDMGLDEWNKQMRTERFFNTEQHPTLRFVARQFHAEVDKPGEIRGELTLLGVTRPIVLAVTRMHCAKHPMLPRQLCGANLQTTIRRSEFGMTYGVPGMSDEIRIVIPVEAIKDS